MKASNPEIGPQVTLVIGLERRTWWLQAEWQRVRRCRERFQIGMSAPPLESGFEAANFRVFPDCAVAADEPKLPFQVDREQLGSAGVDAPATNGGGFSGRRAYCSGFRSLCCRARLLPSTPVPAKRLADIKA